MRYEGDVIFAQEGAEVWSFGQRKYKAMGES